jgi:hypothetical protein
MLSLPLKIYLRSIGSWCQNLKAFIFKAHSRNACASIYSERRTKEKTALSLIAHHPLLVDCVTLHGCDSGSGGGLCFEGFST